MAEGHLLMTVQERVPQSWVGREDTDFGVGPHGDPQDKWGSQLGWEQVSGRLRTAVLLS